jgi:hypothetical protein
MLAEADAKVEAAEVGSALWNFRQTWRRAGRHVVDEGPLSEGEKQLARAAAAGFHVGSSHRDEKEKHLAELAKRMVKLRCTLLLSSCSMTMVPTG